jgi:hypothetical protein
MSAAHPISNVPGASAAPRKPAIILVIGGLSLYGGCSVVLALVMPVPVIFLGVELHGAVADFAILGSGALAIAAGIGLLRFHKWGLIAAFCGQALGLVNTLCFLLNRKATGLILSPILRLDAAPGCSNFHVSARNAVDDGRYYARQHGGRIDSQYRSRCCSDCVPEGLSAAALESVYLNNLSRPLIAHLCACLVDAHSNRCDNLFLCRPYACVWCEDSHQIGTKTGAATN